MLVGWGASVVAGAGELVIMANPDEGSSLKDLPDGFLTDVEAVTEIGHRVAAVAERTRVGLDPVGDADLVSQDLAIEVLRGLEKHLWMLQTQVAGPTAIHPPIGADPF